MSELGLVSKTVAVLRVVAAHPEGIGLSEVARTSGLAKATCHRVLAVLQGEGWLDLDPETRRFRTSLTLSLLFHRDLSGGAMVDFARSILRDLASTVRETVGLDRLDGATVVVMAEVAGPHVIGHAVRPVPRLQDPWRTSTGKVLLAWRDADVVRPAFESAAVRNQAGRYATWRDFVDELERVREQGYSTAYDDLETGLAAVAAPIWVDGRVEYAVWVGGPTYRITPEAFGGLAETVIEVATHLGDVLTRARRAGGSFDLSGVGQA
ncbi:IclR family transcriptional regulator [Microbacterium aoyamense]|uniref:IclR family transcriptional regulator n=1 Tax=Microbacterium aoyamense TaxID=344166 RepID=A0ABN2PLG1_9MICO|nr:IclR family transcriptional regulator [Microbacterium aoyamense]